MTTRTIRDMMSMMLGFDPGDFPAPTSPEQLAAARYDPGMMPEGLAPVGAVHRRVPIRSREGVELTADVVVPEGEGPWPVVLYVHGGGWTVGTPDMAARPVWRMASAGFCCVNLDYGLAPEHPFPWAVEDVVYAARWIRDGVAAFGGDGSRAVLAGDSAGANLVAAAAHVLNVEPDSVDGGDLAGVPVALRGLLLVSGVFDFPLWYRAPRGHAGHVEVSYNHAYLGPHFLALHRDPRVSPIYSGGLDRFPPVYLSCGSYDLVLPQTTQMAQAFLDAGTPTEMSIVPAVDHCFMYYEDRFPDVIGAEMDRVVAWLRTVTSDADPFRPHRMRGLQSLMQVYELPAVGIPTDVDQIPATRARMNPGPDDLGPVASHQTVEIRPATDGVPALTADVTVPCGEGPFPVVIYVHGGAWSIGDPQFAWRPARLLAAQGNVVVNVDYRLAPEHPFPAGLTDVVYAARWVTRYIADHGGDPGRIVISGDSAGANLSAAAIHVVHGDPASLPGAGLDDVTVRFAGAVLVSGVYDMAAWADHISRTRSIHAGTFEVVCARGYIGPHYLATFPDPRVSPARSPHLAAFPPTYLSCGDIDAVAHQTILMAAALSDAEVPTAASLATNVDHCFVYYEHLDRETVAPELARIAAWLHHHTDQLATTA